LNFTPRMEYKNFVNILSKKIRQENTKAHQNMAPFSVADREKMLRSNPNPRLSAVMILIFNKNEQAHFSLIERPKYDGVHSGQMALPGGSKDDDDSDLKQTALRELEEEVGVKPDKVIVLGKLSEIYIPPSKFLVTPYVGILDTYPQYIKDDHEVEQIIDVPISLLFDDSILKKGSVDVGVKNMKMKVPYFDIFGHKVWGATALILSEFKAVMK